MPDITTKLGLEKPLGNEVVSRAAYNRNLDILETMAAREQFPIKSLSYDEANNRIAVTLGPGIAELFNGDVTALISKDADTTYYINTPAINTTYYIYLQADGTFASNTTGVIPTGTALLWTVITGAAVDTLTALDKRAVLSAAGAKLTAHLAETVPPSPGSTVLTYTGSQLTKVEEKDGTGAVIKTTNLTYDANGVLTSTTEVVNGKTTTTTLNRDGSGVLTSVTRSVA